MCCFAFPLRAVLSSTDHEPTLQAQFVRPLVPPSSKHAPLCNQSQAARPVRTQRSPLAADSSRSSASFSHSHRMAVRVSAVAHAVKTHFRTCAAAKCSRGIFTKITPRAAAPVATVSHMHTAALNTSRSSLGLNLSFALSLLRPSLFPRASFVSSQLTSNVLTSPARGAASRTLRHPHAVSLHSVPSRVCCLPRNYGRARPALTHVSLPVLLRPAVRTGKRRGTSPQHFECTPAAHS
ncbi:hypothetical protein TRVL_05690 [Trypanosoma vivax]|nr:hypothetical protein TRVL_05690 [Trypanosoma vivax]